MSGKCQKGNEIYLIFLFGQCNKLGRCFMYSKNRRQKIHNHNAVTSI